MSFAWPQKNERGAGPCCPAHGLTLFQSISPPWKGKQMERGTPGRSESHPREQGGQLWNFGVSPNSGSLSHAWGWDAPMGTASPRGAAPLGGGSGAVVILWKTTQFGFLGKGLLLEAELAIASSALSSVSPGFTALRWQEG